MSAVEVADAIGDGLRSRPAGRPVPGGRRRRGNARGARAAFGGELEAAQCTDPLGREIEASFAIVAGPGDRTVAVVEMAAASGLALVSESERDALAASTFGTGQLIAAAVDRGAEVVYVGVGGSATTDGGAGAIKAIRQAGGLHDAKLVVLCDVRTAFEDAARIFGPQKGAGKDEIRRLTKRLNDMAGRLDRDPRGVPMTGAAGGLSGACGRRSAPSSPRARRSSSMQSSSTAGCGPPAPW